MEGGISISEDPNIRFNYDATSGDALEVRATDSEGGKFAEAHHLIAVFVYVVDRTDIARVRKLLERIDGIAEIWGEAEKQAHGLDHQRSGELIAISQPDAWFTYYYWLDDAHAPTSPAPSRSTASLATTRVGLFLHSACCS